jgi:glycolate oxidase
MSDPRVDELRALLPDAHLITDPDVMDAYRRDEAHLVAPGDPLAVLLARSTEEVSAALRWANEHEVPVVPRGAGTGLAGGATAVDGCLVLSLARMSQILDISGPDQLAVV